MDSDPTQQPTTKSKTSPISVAALLLAATALTMLLLQIGKSRQETQQLHDEIQSLKQAAASNQIDEIHEQIRQLASNHLALSQQSVTALQLSNLVNELTYSRANLGGLLDRLNSVAHSSNSPATLQAQAEQITRLEARLGALNATPIPYTPEELGLLRSDRSVVRKRDLAQMADISREAERAYQNGRPDEAERHYQKLLEFNPRDHLTLANLGTVQMELGKLREAEANLMKALDLHNSDAKTVSLLGLVKLRQQELGQALDYLSRSAAMQPDNAETHNYIGIVLSQQGHRTAAETAFRKALKLAPNYPVAHFNLAVYYITGKPPAAGLAKYHYEKAVKAGHPKSARVEQMIASAP